MAFLGIYKAIYDYAPQSDGELEIKESDLLFVLEKSTDDDWWKAKKKATSDDEDEPEGLIPSNYIEEVRCQTPGPCRAASTSRCAQVLVSDACRSSLMKTRGPTDISGQGAL